MAGSLSWGGTRLALAVWCVLAGGLLFASTPASATEPVAPGIGGVSTSEITDATATLEAQISPENSETKYEVVIADPCPAPMECIRDVSLAGGTIPATTARESVRVELANKELNLEPNTPYEYWVVAKNAVGPTEVHAIFTTLKTPSIDSESATDITEYDAILEANINPAGQDVRYQFQIARNASEFLPGLACPTGRTTELCLGSPATAGALPIGFLVAGSADDSVGLDLEREIGVTLQPETTYHYRVIAVSSPLTEDTIEWKGPTVYGADQTFKTQAPKTTGLGDLPTSGSFSAGPGNFAPPGGRELDSVKPKTPAQVKAAKLARALRLCKQDHKKSKRAKCDKEARKKYGPPSKRTSKKR